MALNTCHYVLACMEIVKLKTKQKRIWNFNERICIRCIEKWGSTRQAHSKILNWKWSPTSIRRTADSKPLYDWSFFFGFLVCILFDVPQQFDKMEASVCVLERLTKKDGIISKIMKFYRTRHCCIWVNSSQNHWNRNKAVRNEMKKKNQKQKQKSIHAFRYMHDHSNRANQLKVKSNKKASRCY